MKTFEINAQYLVEQARFIASPNFNLRPEDTVIDLIVVHNISLPPEEFKKDYVTDLFTNKLDPQAHPYFKTVYQLKVSAHFYIRRDGELIQYVPVDKRAWHAGTSVFRERTECNDFSIGIELEGADTIPFTDTQYDVLARLVKCLQIAYPAISNDNIVGHSDIAPERKTDPGPFFDWDKLRLKLGSN